MTEERIGSAHPYYWDDSQGYHHGGSAFGQLGRASPPKAAAEGVGRPRSTVAQLQSAQALVVPESPTTGCSTPAAELSGGDQDRIFHSAFQLHGWRRYPPDPCSREDGLSKNAAVLQSRDQIHSAPVRTEMVQAAHSPLGSGRRWRSPPSRYLYGVGDMIRSLRPGGMTSTIALRCPLHGTLHTGTSLMMIGIRVKPIGGRVLRGVRMTFATHGST